MGGEHDAVGIPPARHQQTFIRCHLDAALFQFPLQDAEKGVFRADDAWAAHQAAQEIDERAVARH